jgi:hypothetical protein
MKKFFKLIFGSLFAKVIIANPVPAPYIFLNKVLFDSTNNWTIELYYENFQSPLNYQYDSIWIGSKYGKSSLKNINKPSGNGFILVTKDSLKKEIIINPKRDIISLGINGYEMEEIYIDTFKSNGKGDISSLRKGQSISYTGNTWGIYSKSKCQNLGIFMDTCGVFGFLKGNIFDVNNKLVLNRHYNFASLNGSDPEITINPDGSYQGKIISSSCHKWYNQICYFIGTEFYLCDFKTIFLDSVEPDTIIFRDIYLSDSLISTLNTQVISSNDIFKLYPNRITNSSNIYYEIALPVISSSCYLNLYNQNGQVIEKFRIVNKNGVLSLPTDIKKGQYFVCLILNKTKIATNKILIE